MQNIDVLSGPAPSHARPSPEAEAPARASAIRRGVEALRAAQMDDGGWKSTPDMGPLAFALMALTEAWLGSLTSGDAKRYANALKEHQLPDGGFKLHPCAEGSSLGPTAVCRAALKACKVADTSPAVRAAEARIRALGGYDTVRARLVSHGEPAALFCVMVGLLPAEVLPPLSPDMAALPWSERMLDGRFHGGVPMVLYAIAAVRERGARERLLPSFLRAPARALARSRLAAYIGQFQNPNGSWNCAVFSTVFALVALSGVGIDARDPMVRRGLEWLETRKERKGATVRISIFDGTTWETAFSLLALSACGVAPSDEAMRAGARYLEASQCRGTQPRVNQPRAGAPRTGGWAFQSGNDTMPDCDDTALALAALGRCDVPAEPSRGPAIQGGIAWLRGMQNPGGGFGSYVHGLPDKPAGQPIFTGAGAPLRDLRSILECITNPPAEYGDPAIADLVGRVLWGLGEHGLGVDDPMVARAVAFLERDACPNGSWWGVWNPAYIAGTAFVLLGLARVGADLKAPFVQKAIAWLVSVQNEDGGFGERAASFLDPRLAGKGPSMPPLTGIALRALAEVVSGGAASARVVEAGARAARYLVAQQEPDGSWPNGEYVFTIVPPTFYTWGHHRLYYVLFGLGRWDQVANARAARRRAK